MNLTMQLISHKSEQMLADHECVLSDVIWQVSAETQTLHVTVGWKWSAHLLPQTRNLQPYEFSRPKTLHYIYII